MFKKTINILAQITLIVFVTSSAFAQDENLPSSFVSVCSAIVFDLDNDTILFEQNADQRIAPASLTKILSMFLAMDFIKNGHATMATPVTVSKGAANTGGSRMSLLPNEQVSFGKLLLGMAVSSGNDASYAIAEYVGGSADSFVKMMNIRAKELGMTNSNFRNPHGLPDKFQYTTARDMLSLARAYLRAYPEALILHNTLLLTHNGYTSWNKNPLLGQYPGVDGLKSGWVRASGYNLIFTAKRNGRRLLAVILGAPDTTTRGAEACRLLDAGFMVCENKAMSINAALENIPFIADRIDPLKTGREAGLLKKKLVGRKFYAQNSIKYSKPKNKTVIKNNAKNVRKVGILAKTSHKRKTHAERRIYLRKHNS